MNPRTIDTDLEDTGYALLATQNRVKVALEKLERLHRVLRAEAMNWNDQDLLEYSHDAFGVILILRESLE